MKGFIEVQTQYGKELINVNQIIKVCVHNGNLNDKDKCLIMLAVSNSKRNNGVESLYSIEDYDTVVLRISQAI